MPCICAHADRRTAAVRRIHGAYTVQRTHANKLVGGEGSLAPLEEDPEHAMRASPDGANALTRAALVPGSAHYAL